MWGGRDCRSKELGQAQTLKKDKMLSFCEFIKEMLSFGEVILPKMRFRPAQTLKLKKMFSFCEFMKEVLSFGEVILPKMRFRPTQTLNICFLFCFVHFANL